MACRFPLILSAAALLAASCFARAQDTLSATPVAAAGSAAFCLYELPSVDDKRRWVNLGIVQYVESSRNELRIYYGGGNLGSGHEARIPVSNPAQLKEMLDRIRQAAADCR